MNIDKRKFILSIIATLILGLALGWFIFKGNQPTDKEKHEHTEKLEAEETIWTCSMHPQIRQSEAGDCPICGMELIPLEESMSESIDPNAISMTPTAMQLASVRTATVGSMDPVKKVHLTGKVQEDERLVFSQSSHLPGRIEKLNVNFTGEFVQKGQVLAHIYSPDLVTAQEEVFEARKIKDEQPALYQSAIEKLRNWKLSEFQVQRILNAKKTIEKFPIVADVSGYVISKKVKLGDYINKGESIYEIADLSKVWVLFDVYESDMPWIHKGDKVNFTLKSAPGREFEGKISYLDPILNAETRVSKARVEIDNKNNLLKPEMFVSGVVEASLKEVKEALVIPKSAVMWTGKRSVVYVKESSKSAVSFVMREITIGAELGDGYIVKNGLSAGEEIAVSGTFSIDAAAQLAGKPSMMNPEGSQKMSGHHHGEPSGQSTSSESSQPIKISKAAKSSLAPLFDAYLQMKNALVSDDFNKSKSLAASLEDKLTSIEMSVFKGEAHEIWMQRSKALSKDLKLIQKTKNIGEMRRLFEKLSNQFIMLAINFKPLDKKLYIQHCPMVNENEGADWLSEKKEILNPYFGKSMIGCGSTTKTLN